MRVMSVDFGTKAIGLAICDELQLAVRPLTTLRHPHLQQAPQRIGQLAEEYDIGTLVVGLPLNMDGTSGEAVEKVELFVAELRKHIFAPIEMVDERLTSLEADQILREMGVGMKERKAKSDEYAAVLILQDYLDGLARQQNQESTSI